MQLLTAAIKVIHRIDNVLAFGHEAHKYEADGCTRSAAITGALQTNAGRTRDVPSPPANQVVLYWSIEGDREQ